MRDELLREFVWIAWHLKGAFTLREWLDMAASDREVIKTELAARIEIWNGQMP